MKLFERFNYIWTELNDERTKDWLLINSTYQIPLIICIYLLLIFSWIPRFMKNKPPYQLKIFIQFYNGFQIVANAWLVREHIAAGWLRNIPLTCLPVTYSYKLPHYKFAQITWWILMLKIVDFLETIFFALRKKKNQISTLHVYHHISNVIISWISVKYISGEMITFFTLLNCGVHVIMYIYYFLAAFGPHVQAVISPIKLYITKIQIVQFCIMIIYILKTVLTPNCNVSPIIHTMVFWDIVINWYMFYKFYQSSYTLKVKQ